MDVGEITCTLLRKTLITKSREEGVDETEKDVMALQMDHQKARANRYYDVSTGGNMSAQFRRIFQKFYDPLSLTDDECSDDDLNSTRH